ncbi:MAG: hypothetical protein KAH77_08365 [Thiomargarita sp.]|nr:hypothetical protein [Thiomargarita sp.]
MNNLNKPQKRSISILGLKIEGVSPEHTENVRQAMVMLLSATNPDIFKKEKSPQEILHLLNFKETIKKTESGRWAKVADRFRKHSMSRAAGDEMDKAIKQFREEFAFHHDLKNDNA